jgi:hypothetical protein
MRVVGLSHLPAPVDEQELEYADLPLNDVSS